MIPIERKARELLAAHGPDRWWYPTPAHPDEYIGWKYGDTWDNLKDARESYEGLADAYTELREIVEAITALTPPAGGLPELPLPVSDVLVRDKAQGDPEVCEAAGDYYTAAQLREYAIQAVRQAANAIFAEGWYLACDWMERDDLKFDVDSPAFAADRAARLAALLTLLENNSDH